MFQFSNFEHTPLSLSLSPSEPIPLLETQPQSSSSSAEAAPIFIFSLQKTNHWEEPRENYDNVKFTEHTAITHARASNGPWKEDGLDLKPCWTKPSLEEAIQTDGFVTFSLTNGPEYHVSQDLIT
ncbi:unnamed protein product [Camellia sinensis]